MMKPEIKARWLTALRSKEYAQGRGALCQQHNGIMEFCCLGVLSDLYAKDHNVPWMPPDRAGKAHTLHCEAGELPNQVLDWIGLEDHNPTVLFRDSEGVVENFQLSTCNDDLKLSFG